MSNSRMLTGSIDLTKLGELVRANHPAVVKAQNGKKYLNLTVWVNEEVNEYDQIGSISVYHKDTKEKTYLGNLKEWQNNQVETTSSGEDSDDDLPY